MARLRYKWYVGVRRDGSRRAFRSVSIPTGDIWGALYGYVIGPFDTKKGALWAEARLGCQSVYEAEKAVKNPTKEVYINW
jgi:hypothetical protein